jgi:hypothetical protein
MTVQLGKDGTILMIDDCPAADAELLLSHLLTAPEAAINWGSCQSAHTSVVQVLLACGSALIGPPRGELLKAMIEPALDRARAKIQPSRGAMEMRNI